MATLHLRQPRVALSSPVPFGTLRGSSHSVPTAHGSSVQWRPRGPPQMDPDLCVCFRSNEDLSAPGSRSQIYQVAALRTSANSPLSARCRPQTTARRHSARCGHSFYFASLVAAGRSSSAHPSPFAVSHSVLFSLRTLDSLRFIATVSPAKSTHELPFSRGQRHRRATKKGGKDCCKKGGIARGALSP
ncbi:hypothetical protein HPB50_024253 [Hyalomma asiaticum]|uniref:Uncharacterized protein n=1 Tax=Hyalomma asiaticum TaxID=266040 RepID=A0ACB7SBE6_HYAAI|nr:hypothetical protein HPB50_024253 [Hyalomma asiaticum]